MEFVPFNFVLNPKKAVPEVLRLGNGSFLCSSRFDEHWLVPALYPGELIGRHLKWRIILWSRQKNRTQKIWFLLFDQSHKSCMTLGKTINSFMSCLLQQNWEYECFVFNFTFLQTEGQLCKLFFIDCYSKDLISALLLSVSKIQNKKNLFILPWSVFIWILKSEQVVFYINWA